MEKRNRKAVEKGELSDQRYGEFPLMQFSDIYSVKCEGQRTFEQLTREQVITSYDENFDRGIEAARMNGSKLPSEEEIAKHKIWLRGELLNNLGFKEGVDMVEVTPKNPNYYDIYIDTSKQTPETSAQIIHRGTYKR